MNKYLKLQLQLKVIRYPDQIGLFVEFGKGVDRDWCLGLCLLKEGLIETLLVSGKEKDLKFEIARLGNTNGYTRGRVQFEDGITRLKIPTEELDNLVSFFLKYYRDGVAQVRHVDIDATCESADDATIIFIVQESAPPLSAEEGKRMLGLS